MSNESKLTKIERWLLSDGVAHCRGHGGAGGVRASAELAVTEGVLSRVLAARESARSSAHSSGSGSSSAKLRGWIVVTT